MSEPNQSERDKLDKIVELHLHQLGEHFPNVQIFVNGPSPHGDGTYHFSKGTGNHFARIGQITEWIEYQNCYVAAKAGRDFDHDNPAPDDDDGEDGAPKSNGGRS